MGLISQTAFDALSAPNNAPRFALTGANQKCELAVRTITFDNRRALFVPCSWCVTVPRDDCVKTPR